MIQFDASLHLILISLASSSYVLRITPEQDVVHVLHRPVASALQPAQLGNLDHYDEASPNLEHEGRAYEYPVSGDTAYPEVALRVAFPRAPGPLKAGEAPHLPVRDLRLRYVRHEILKDARPALAPEHGLAPAAPADGQTLRIDLVDTAYAFEVSLFYRVSPARDVIERWVELRNRTDMAVEVERLSFATLHLPIGRWELTSLHGTWARETQITRETLQPGVRVLQSRGLNTGWRVQPGFMLSRPGLADEERGEVYFGALAYGGGWSLRFEVLPTGQTRVHAGYNVDDFSLTLPPGATHRTPALVFGCASDGFGGASRRLHRFTREQVLPVTPKSPVRPVLYNSWEATTFNVRADQQIALARKAAAIGVELFVVDDGWFGGRRHDKAGLGDWFEAKECFPNGMRELTDEVRKLGMRFGLWFEPEMINPDSDLYRAHPDWVLHNPGRPRREIRNQLMLDLGRPEVVAYLHERLRTLVRDAGIDFIKWDMNRYVTESGSVAGQGLWQAHIAGVYSLMDRLRAEFPDLEIESCSGGGGRADLGVFSRTDQAWTSDNTDALDRLRIQEGFSLLYPQRTMMCWVTHHENGISFRELPLQLRFDTAMRGSLGIGESLDKLTDEELKEFAAKIAFYKRIRAIVQNGDLYRLASLERDGFSVWQTTLTDGSKAVLSYVMPSEMQGVIHDPIRLKGLKAGATYRVTDEKGAELGRYTGAQLATLGMPYERRSVDWKAAVRAQRSRTLLLEETP
ncbi:alpha-galactosidase [Nibricoccus sp. IMCC34717]|uniref:alpha-galactosidase n=1 Tax=Nibricoccus sp. IMCC34717 TaxID=3034021 RepID=UPI00384A6444